MNPQLRLCPNCNRACRPAARFCTACGVPLEPRACARCGIAAEAGDRYCGACGGFLSAKAPEAASAPPPAAAPAPAAAKPSAPTPELAPEDAALYESLRRWRTEQAGVESVPRYAVFNNAQLAEIAKSKPATQAALAAIKGIGSAKAAKYFEAVRKALGGGQVKERRAAYALAG